MKQQRKPRKKGGGDEPPLLQGTQGDYFRAAAMLGDTAKLRKLKEEGVDVDERSNDATGNFTAIMYAAIKGQTEAIKVLHELGADLDGSLTRTGSLRQPSCWQPNTDKRRR